MQRESAATLEVWSKTSFASGTANNATSALVCPDASQPAATAYYIANTAPWPSAPTNCCDSRAAKRAERRYVDQANLISACMKED
uniref:Uncharacterized protein n=1 Tax=Mycena chlorophos TaxID=658473 RepID=A0ABQ0KVB5_MYCCL|nr:predicted protein [Mycena chlorophos]